MTEETELAESSKAESYKKASYKKVLRALIESNGAMPFLELASVSDVGDEKLEEIVTALEKDRLVTVINPDDIFEKIITVTGQGFSVAQTRP
ncbi:MAG TPA: hypothetical protein VI837_07825 [Blastocatellia bacterium]|nr:hypothetical protein [Blastocatellia bacterium]